MTNRREILQAIVASGTITGIATNSVSASEDLEEPNKIVGEYKITMDELSESEFGALISSNVVEKEVVKSRLGLIQYQKLSSVEMDLIDELKNKEYVILEGRVPQNIRKNRIIIDRGSKYRINLLPTI